MITVAHPPLSLIEKYDVAVPRYTSYPTVPFWSKAAPEAPRWKEHVNTALRQNRDISLYLHLPYCEKLCTYCGCNKHITKNHRVEMPYIKALLQEWKLYREQMDTEPRLVELHLGGGTPTFFSPENLRYLIEQLLRDLPTAQQPDLSFEAHPNSTSYAHLHTLRELGFNRVSLGVQDFAPEIMAVINRQQTEAEITQVTQWARELGYQSINYDLIYGLPLQKLSHIETNLERVAQLRPDRIAFYSYAHVPSVKPGQRAYSEEHLPKGSAKYHLYQRGKEGLLALGYEDMGMDHFALPQDDLAISAREERMHRNFMGYTTRHTRLNIGLGASAISDSWSAYAQNEKTTAAYLKQVQSGQLPLLKNHFLSEAEQSTRRQILDLICHFQCRWNDTSAALLPSQLAAFRQMEQDGLLQLRENELRINPLGRSFIRNICAVLDDYLLKSTGEKPVFSRAV